MSTPRYAQTKQKRNAESAMGAPPHDAQRAGLSADVLSLQRTAGNSSVNNLVSSLGRGDPLPTELRGELEQRFGEDFSKVRLHTDVRAAQSASELSAKAYTVGNNIVFNEGRFTPGTTEGKRLVAHELAHVVQQRRGGGRPPLDSRTPHEQSAEKTADAVVENSGQIAVSGGSDVGVAREKDEDEEKRKQANMTVVTQRAKKTPPPPRYLVEAPKQDLPVHVIDAPYKAKGTGAEVTVPWELYSGWEWNHLGGGEETKTSRTSIAKDTVWGPTAGIDFLVENIKTDQLVIGEQKALNNLSFDDATAITTGLETNVKHAREQLQKKIDNGQVHPDEVARLRRTVARLEATEKALNSHSDLPEGVVFEFTNISGKSENIGKGHVDLLAKAFKDDSGKADSKFIEHLLSRTFVRDAKGVVPASELLTPEASDVLARLRSGKNEKQWKKQKEKERAREEKIKRDEDAAEKKSQREQRLEGERRAKEDAKNLGDKAREERLKQLKDEKAFKGETESSTKRKREQAEKKLEREARDAGKDKEKESLAEYYSRRKRQEAEARTKRKADEQLQSQARKAKRDAEDKASDQLSEEKEKIREQKEDAVQKAKDAGEFNEKTKTLKTPEALQRMNDEARRQESQRRDYNEAVRKINDEARRRNQSQRREAGMTKGAHYANQLAAVVRAVDAFQYALDKDRGYLEATYQGGKTFLENTNPVIGAIGTAESRQQKDPITGEQYYGDDAVDAWLGTLGETGAGLAVPGAGWDQVVNAGANLIAAVDDHMNRSLDPSDPSLRKATVRTATDLAGELTPSRMISSLAGGSARAAYDLGRIAKGDYKGVNKFGEDAVRGKLGSIFQPAGMAGDFFGNLGSDDVGTALEKTVKKTEGTTLTKLGYASGDAMYELGQSQKAKSGDQGMHVQGVSMILGATSDVIAGQSLEKALSKQAEAGKGSLADKIGSASADAMYKFGQSKEAKAGDYGPIVQGYARALGIASDVLAGDSVEKALEKAAGSGKGSLTDKVGSALGDMAYDTVEKSKEILNEDIPAAKKRLKDWWKSL